MKYSFGRNFEAKLENFPPATQKKFWKQLDYLLQNLRYPSLQTKKYDELRGIWQARVDRGIRLYFLIEGDTYILLDVRKHPK